MSHLKKAFLSARLDSLPVCCKGISYSILCPPPSNSSRSVTVYCREQPPHSCLFNGGGKRRGIHPAQIKPLRSHSLAAGILNVLSRPLLHWGRNLHFKACVSVLSGNAKMSNATHVGEEERGMGQRSIHLF